MLLTYSYNNVKPTQTIYLMSHDIKAAPGELDVRRAPGTGDGLHGRLASAGLSGTDAAGRRPAPAAAARSPPCRRINRIRAGPRDARKLSKQTHNLNSDAPH